MAHASPVRYRFARFELQPDERRLMADQQTVHLGPRAFDLLVALVERAGHLVTKEALLSRIWNRVIVEENALQAQVSMLRKVLGQRAIATVAGQGYRFALAVEALQAPSQAGTVPKHNLPQQLTNFIGREREIAEIRRWLEATRLLTLTGAGGCGKTRLALQVAAAVHDGYPNGTWLVELAPLADPMLIGQVLSNVLMVETQPAQDPVDAVTEWLGSQRTLLVLDNAEHLIDACARLAERLLQRCAGLTVLVTSRERLGIDGELNYRVPSLSLPNGPTSEGVLSSEAARLFIDRARLQRLDFEVSVRDADELAAICHRLDGIALAIELAAPRMRVMSLEALSQGLDDRFRLLTGGSRTALPRHRTLRSLIEWSHELLTEAEKLVLRRAAVFSNGWTLKAAERVCSGNGVDPESVLDLLGALVDKNLVVAEPKGLETRFAMLETVRHYALERLRDSGEEALARERQLVCLTAMAGGLDVPDGAATLQAASRLDAEHDNLRAVFAWCASEPSQVISGLNLARLLGMYWQIRGLRGEEVAWLTRLLDAAPPAVRPDLRAMVLSTAAICQLGQGDQSEARAAALASVALCRRQGDRRALGRALVVLAEADVYLGDADMARRHNDEALSIARELGDPRDIVSVLNNLALAAWQSGDMSAAQAIVDEALDLGRDDAVGSWITAPLFVILAGIRRELGDIEAARAASNDALRAYRECGHRAGVAMSLLQLIRVSLDMGDLSGAWVPWREASGWMPGGSNYWVEWLDAAGGLVARSGRTIEAARLWGCVQTQRARRSLLWRPRYQIEMQHAARGALADDAAFDRALAEGSGWALDEGIRRAWMADSEIASERSQG